VHWQDAAKAAADIILLAPGLGTIIVAMRRSRKIFQRLQGYVIYRIASSVLIQGFFFLSIVALEFYMSIFLLIILSLVNDFTALSISSDYVVASPFPEKFRLLRTLLLAAAIGGCGVAAAFLFVYLASPLYVNWWPSFGLAPLDNAQVVAAVFLLLVTLIQLNIFITRTAGLFFSRRPSLWVTVSVVMAILAAVFIAVYFPANSQVGGPFPISGIGWGHAMLTVFYCVLSFVVTDLVKFLIIRYVWPPEAAADAATASSSVDVPLSPTLAEAALAASPPADTPDHDGGEHHTRLTRRVSTALYEDESIVPAVRLRRRDVLAMNARRLAAMTGRRRTPAPPAAATTTAAVTPAPASAAPAGAPSLPPSSVAAAGTTDGTTSGGLAPARSVASVFAAPRRPSNAIADEPLPALVVTEAPPATAASVPATTTTTTATTTTASIAALPVATTTEVAALVAHVQRLEQEQGHMLMAVAALERHQTMLFRFLMGDLGREDVLAVLHASGYAYAPVAATHVLATPEPSSRHPLGPAAPSRLPSSIVRTATSSGDGGDA
jgi:hypothetical protein